MIIISSHHHETEKTHYMQYFQKGGDWINIKDDKYDVPVCNSCRKMINIIQQAIFLGVVHILKPYIFQSEFRTIVRCPVSLEWKRKSGWLTELTNVMVGSKIEGCRCLWVWGRWRRRRERVSLFPPNDAWYGGNRATAALLPMQYYNFATAEKIVQCSVL